MGNQKSINCGASGLQIQFFFLYIKCYLLPIEKMEGVRKSSQTISKEYLREDSCCLSSIKNIHNIFLEFVLMILVLLFLLL